MQRRWTLERVAIDLEGPPHTMHRGWGVTPYGMLAPVPIENQGKINSTWGFCHLKTPCKKWPMNERDYWYCTSLHYWRPHEHDEGPVQTVQSGINVRFCDHDDVLPALYVERVVLRCRTHEPSMFCFICQVYLPIASHSHGYTFQLIHL